MKITNRQIARAARKIWPHYREDFPHGRHTVRSVLTVLGIPHETPKPRRAKR